jgi:hypothetical protein
MSLSVVLIYRMNENFKAIPIEGQSTPQHKKDYMNIGLLQPGFQARAS